jgi:hypothetical protein
MRHNVSSKKEISRDLSLFGWHSRNGASYAAGKMGEFNLVCDRNGKGFWTLRHQLIDPPMLSVGESTFVLRGLQKSLFLIGLVSSQISGDLRLPLPKQGCRFEPCRVQIMQSKLLTNGISLKNGRFSAPSVTLF